MKSNRICIMAWAQEIDRSISSASYHVAIHLLAFAFTGGVELIQSRSPKLSQKVRATDFPKLSQINIVF
jgi:hypothetical protein